MRLRPAPSEPLYCGQRRTDATFGYLLRATYQEAGFAGPRRSSSILRSSRWGPPHTSGRGQFSCCAGSEAPTSNLCYRLSRTGLADELIAE